MKRPLDNSRISLFVLFLLFHLNLSSCYNFDNPVDPEAPSYEGTGSSPGWLSGWTCRKRIDLSGSSSGPVVDYPVKIMAHYASGTDFGENMYLAGHCLTDFLDVRFSGGDGETLLDFWIQERDSSDHAIFWIEIPSVDASDGAVLYCYFGNPLAADVSNGKATFLLFDEFDGAGFDTDIWAGDMATWTHAEMVGEAEGAAVCSSADSKLYSRAAFSDSECFALIKSDLNTSVYLAIRDESSVNPSPDASRYDLFFEAISGPSFSLFLRRTESGSTSELQEASSTYSDRFNLVRIGAVGGSLVSEFDTLPLIYLDSSALPHGGVSVGTGSPMLGAVYVDWIAVRPLADPEPAIEGWGEEETEG